MRLLVSSWYPYQHQANALDQVIHHKIYAREVMFEDGSSLYGPSLGPFMALIEDGFNLPIIGLPGIFEVLDRKFPDRGYLGGPDLVQRAKVRALSAKIEECFSRLCVGDIASHSQFGRKKWLPNSDASARVLEEVPMRLNVLENYQKNSQSRFIVGDNPTLADVLLVALWWTAQDQGLGDVILKNDNLAAWYQRNGHGSPFRRL